MSAPAQPPFIDLRLLERHNIWLSLLILLFMFMLFASGVTLPAKILGNLQGFRMPEIASLGLVVAWPQWLLGPGVALLIQRRWADARHLFAAGMLLIALACILASALTGEWMVRQFLWVQILQAVGQALAVVSLLC